MHHPLWLLPIPQFVPKTVPLRLAVASHPPPTDSQRHPNPAQSCSTRPRRKDPHRTKPIKERPPSRGLVQCAVCSISRHGVVPCYPSFRRRESEQTFNSGVPCHRSRESPSGKLATPPSSPPRPPFLFATFFAYYLPQSIPLTRTPPPSPIDSACDNETGASFRPGREPAQTGTIVPVENR